MTRRATVIPVVFDGQSTLVLSWHLGENYGQPGTVVAVDAADRG